MAEGSSRVNYEFHSLEDFLISSTLTVDDQPEDGWGATFPVKGREIDATILFADITGFSRRTLNLSPAETLIFVNWFFAWVTAEALRGGKGIIDKYIGDEMMIVFSREFGSDDPFLEAVRTARWMAENDVWSFAPHIGLASGRVIVGYVGTPLKRITARYWSTRGARKSMRWSQTKTDKKVLTAIVVPATGWGAPCWDEVLPPAPSPTSSVGVAPDTERVHEERRGR